AARRWRGARRCRRTGGRRGPLGLGAGFAARLGLFRRRCRCALRAVPREVELVGELAELTLLEGRFERGAVLLLPVLFVAAGARLGAGAGPAAAAAAAVASFVDVSPGQLGALVVSHRQPVGFWINPARAGAGARAGRT